MKKIFSLLVIGGLFFSNLARQSDDKVPFAFPVTHALTLGQVIDTLAQVSNFTDEGSIVPPELEEVYEAYARSEKSVATDKLRPLMPFIIAHCAPQLLDGQDIENSDLDYNLVVTRAKRDTAQKQGINADVTQPVAGSQDCDGLIKLICKVCKNIDDCCERLEEDIEEVLETLTECCETLCIKIEETRCGTPITELPFTIDIPGNYYLQKTISVDGDFGIRILSDNVVLDLCCNTIIGENVTSNGVVVDGGFTGIKNVTIKNGVIDNMVENAILAINTINLHCMGVNATRSINGFNLINCQAALIRQSVASCCTHHGFLLQGQLPVSNTRALDENCNGCEGVLNRHNCLMECQALLTRSAEGDAFGFRSIAGVNNTFIKCGAKDTHTSDTVNASRSAGFSLGAIREGSGVCGECGSKIIECEICDTTAAPERDANQPGGSRPVGILLEPQFNENDVELLDQKNQSLLVRSVAWSPDECFLASGGPIDRNDNEIRIWKVNKDGKLTVVDQSLHHGLLVNSVAWSPDECFLASGASGDRNTDIKIWKVDKATGVLTEVVQTLTHGIGVQSVAWSPDGCFLASGANTHLGIGNEIKIWRVDKATGLLTEVSQALNHGLGVQSVAWSPDGCYLASGAITTFGIGTEIKIWRVDKATGELTEVEAKNHGLAVKSVAWSPDGCFLASGATTLLGIGDEIKLWKFNRTTGELNEVDQKNHGLGVETVAWSPDGCFVATGAITLLGFGDEIKIWFVDKAAGTLTEVSALQHGTTAFSVAFSPAGCFLASGALALPVIPSKQASGQIHIAAPGIVYPAECTIKRNQISRVFGGCGGFGIQGGCNNLIINNLAYETDLGYTGVTQVYQNGLCGLPGFFDNVQVPPFCFPCGLCCPVQCPTPLVNG